MVVVVKFSLVTGRTFVQIPFVQVFVLWWWQSYIRKNPYVMLILYTNFDPYVIIRI